MAATLRHLRYVRSAQASNPFAARLRDPRFVRDMAMGGTYRIVGTVTEVGVAGPYRVRLHDRRSALLVRETWSAADGSYSFPNIAYHLNGYYAIAFDHGDNPLNAAIADLITPEPMP